MSMTALILAGGLGTRLRPVVSNLPKSLSPVNGRPFLCYILDKLVDLGLKEVILCIGYLGDSVVQTFGNNYKSLDIKYSNEETPLGTGGAIRQALDLVYTDLVLVMNGDSYCDIDFSSYISWHGKQKAEASIVLAKVDDTSRYGMVKFDEDCKILSFKEKSVNLETGWINGGIYLLKKSIFKDMPYGVNFSLERELFPKLIDAGLYGFLSQGKFIDIGIPEAYFFAEKFFGDD